MVQCKDNCHKSCVNVFPYHIRKYEAGFKYCSICEKWFDIDNFRCPCCHMILRTKSRNGKIRKEEKIASG
jgi:hypothetical protein